MLSNFIRRNGKRKGAKHAKAHEASRRPPSPISPSSFTSPEILDINEKSLKYRALEESRTFATGSTSDHQTRDNVGSPLVHLNFSTDPLEDWFPQELLQGRRSSRGPGGSPGITAAHQCNITQESSQQSSSGSSSKSTVDLLKVEEIEKKSETIDSRAEDLPPRPGIAPWKKSIPAPIIIPDVNHLVPNVQIGHSAATAEAPSLRIRKLPAVDARSKAPPSPVSSEDMSAVSGTTLARALIANSFVLSSSEHRTSRHRSGMARQDSATLPRGDHFLVNSPYWRDKRISGGEVVSTAGSGRTSPIPPVPPMPGGAILEQKRVQRSSSMRSQARSSSELTRRRSGSSTASEYPMSDLYVTSPEMMIHSGGSRRISRIVEVPSPAPTTPATPFPALALALDMKVQRSRSSVALGSIHGTTTESEEPDMPNTASEIPSSAGSQPVSQRPSAESSHTEQFSPSPTDHSLDEYQFVPPGPQTSAITPGSDSSASNIASLPPKRSDSNVGHRKYRADGPAVYVTGGKSRMDFNKSVLDASFQRNNKEVKLLPISDRSLLVPQTPITPALIASSIVTPYSILSQFPLVPSSAVPAGHLEMPLTAGDNLDSSLVPMTGGIFASRQRSAAPEPLRVDQDCSELLNYALTGSPDLSSLSHYTPTSSSAGYQTFPETPMVFSPLWSQEYSFPPGSRTRLLNERPQNARTATVPGTGELSMEGSLSRAMTTVNRRVRKEGEGAGECAHVSRWPQPAASPIQKTPSPEPDLSNVSVSVVEVTQQMVDNSSADVPDETSRSSPLKNTPIKSAEVTDFLDRVKPWPEPPFRPHPLAHISTSSSQLQPEEALQAFMRHSASSMPSISDDSSSTPFTSAPLVTESRSVSPTSIPLPESTNTSPLIPPPLAGSVTSTSPSPSNNLSLPLPQANPSRSPVPVSQTQPSKSSLSAPPTPLPGSSFLPSPTMSSPISPVEPPPPRSPSPIQVPPSPALSNQSVSLSFVAPPPYYAVVSERTVHHPFNSSSQHSLSRTPSSGPSSDRDRQPSLTSSPGPSSRNRVRARPPLPIGPRKPSGPAQPLGAFVPGIRERNNSASSVGSSNHGAGSGSSPWYKLHRAASQPLPKFQTPPPKWRGLTMEAAQWTFTSPQLQAIVSRAIKNSAEGSSIRILRLETLDGEIAEETHRLEMQRTDVKTQYKALVRKRWTLMGALAGHIEGAEMNDTVAAIRTMGELAEVSLTLDQLADELHSIVEQLAQLKNLRDVHHGSALAMALRKVNSTFLRQMAEKGKLHEQIEVLEAERNEAWKHAEDVAQDYDNLNDRMMESAGDAQPNDDDARSTMSSRRSVRVSAVRRSSVRQSKAGLRTLSRHRSRRSSVSSVGNRASMTFPTAEDIPPVPPLPLNQPGGLSATVSPGMSLHSSGTSAARALAQAQQELYEMLGLNVQDTPSEASSRPRTISGPHNLHYASLNLRPMSETGTGASMRPRAHENRATHSAILDGRQAMLATLGMMTN
ncbi:hypothetical protein BS17DRAFT_779368 [Gyrodon lividus]|nr:hypothetical protein BS17DRAFT_779368 [Gyrodon lividus]